MSDSKLPTTKPTNRVPVTEKSGLPPIVLDKSSAYFHPQGIPVTVGDYEQRVKNQLLKSGRPKLKMGWRKSPFGVGAFLLTGTVVAVYTANVVMVYENV